MPMLLKTRFMFMAMAILAALAVALAVALPGVSADGGDKASPVPQSGGTSGDNQAPPIPEKAELNYPNLGSHLDQLVASVETGQATAQGAASNSPLHSGGSVAVTIYLSGNVDEVVSFLEDNGGDPRNVGEDYIEAYVPVSLLGAVSEQPGVVRVREIVPPQPAQTTQQIAGNGPAVHGSLAWNQAGYSGQGVKVGSDRRWLRRVQRPTGHRTAGNGPGQVLHGLGQILHQPGGLRELVKLTMHHGSNSSGITHGYCAAGGSLYIGHASISRRPASHCRLDDRGGCIGNQSPLLSSFV